MDDTQNNELNERLAQIIAERKAIAERQGELIAELHALAERDAELRALAERNVGPRGKYSALFSAEEWAAIDAEYKAFADAELAQREAAGHGPAGQA